jgi:hypothetical protein
MEMTTKHLVIFGAGILAGYLLVDYLRSNNPATSSTNSGTNCPSYIDCMPTTDGTMHEWCTKGIPPECQGKTGKAV